STTLPLGGARGAQSSDGAPPLPPELLPPALLPPALLPPALVPPALLPPTPPEEVTTSVPPGPLPALLPADPPELVDSGDPHWHRSKQAPTVPMKRAPMAGAYPTGG